jgi:hypothetical protein
VGFGPRFNGKTCLANITSMLSNDTSLVSQIQLSFFRNQHQAIPYLHSQDATLCVVQHGVHILTTVPGFTNGSFPPFFW